MKINHTPLGVLASNKKFVAGALALALIGGIAPSFIKGSQALEMQTLIDDLSDSSETSIYTTVGPDYFTIVDELWDYYDEGYNVRVADTSIADFYYGGGSSADRSPRVIEVNSLKTVNPDSTTIDVNDLLSDSKAAAKGAMVPRLIRGYIPPYACEDDLICIQGKKIGNTEILIEKDGEETLHIPLTSVKLTPDAHNVEKSGVRIDGVGSIEGADNNLLILQNISSDTEMGINSAKTGDRSFTMYADENSELPHISPSAYINWSIGEQAVGGGTDYVFIPIEGIDNILNSDSNKNKLEDLMIDLYKTFISKGPIINESSVITTDDGSVVYKVSSGEEYYGLEPQGQNLTLDSSDVRLAEVTKDNLASGLPEGIQEVKFKNISVNLNVCFYANYHGGGGEKAAATMLKSAMYTSSEEAGSDEEVVCSCMSGFSKTAQNLDMAIDVSSSKALKPGYARKWYVVRDNNGVIEPVEAAYDEATQTIRFQSNILGNYAYGYVDELIAKEPEVPAVPNTGVAPHKVATTAIATFLPILAIIFVSFVIRANKRNANKLAKKHNHFE